MYCPKCGKANPDGTEFCSACGTRLGKAAPPPSLTGNGFDADRAPSEIRLGEPAPIKKRKKILPWIAGLVVVLALAAIVYFAIRLALKEDPLETVSDALAKTAEETSASFHMMLLSGNDELKLNGAYAFDTEKQTIELFAEGERFGYIALRLEGGVLSYVLYDSSDESYMVSQEELSQSDVDAMFESLEDADKEENTAFYNEMASLLEDAGFGDTFRLSKLEDFVEDVKDKLTSSDYLEPALGYTKERTNGVNYYTFAPNLYDCLEVAVKTSKKYFRDDEAYDDTEDVLLDKSIESLLNRIQVTLTFGIDDDRIVSLEATLAPIRGLIEREISFEFVYDNFGDAKVTFPGSVKDALAYYEETGASFFTAEDMEE